MSDYLPLAEHKNDKRLYLRAKQLRKSSSFAERLLWNELRNLPKEMHLKFRRQHPIHPYVVDLVCLKLNLIIELDGDSHDSRRDYDDKRTRYLNQSGYTVLRFTNEDVYRNREGVMRHILHAAKERMNDIVAPLP